MVDPPMVFSLYKGGDHGHQVILDRLRLRLHLELFVQNGLRKLLPVNVSYSRVTESQLI